MVLSPQFVPVPPAPKRGFGPFVLAQN